VWSEAPASDTTLDQKVWEASHIADDVSSHHTESFEATRCSLIDLKVLLVGRVAAKIIFTITSLPHASAWG